MDEHGEQCWEKVFEIVWHQHDPEDWMAVITDTHSDQRRQVCSWEELQQFIHAHLWTAEPQTVDS